MTVGLVGVAVENRRHLCSPGIPQQRTQIGFYTVFMPMGHIKIHTADPVNQNFRLTGQWLMIVHTQKTPRLFGAVSKHVLPGLFFDDRRDRLFNGSGLDGRQRTLHITAAQAARASSHGH